jgi:hypothetical protein
MQQSRWPSTILTVIALLGALLPLACTRDVPLYAPATAVGGIFVRVREAEIDDDRVRVKMTFQNATNETLHVDRDGMALRLPDGRVLPRDGGRHDVYTLAPGESHAVHVDFRGPDDLRHLTGAAVIVGGIRFGADPYPRAVGEVPLSRDPGVLGMVAGTLPRPVPVQAAPPLPAPVDTTSAEPATVRGDVVAGGSRVAVDVTTLDDASFQRLDGSALEKQIVVRLVQEGFAVVGTSVQPAVVLTVHSMGHSVLLQAYGPAGMHRREVAAEVGARRVPTTELRLELSQKAVELVRAALGSQQGPTRSL